MASFGIAPVPAWAPDQDLLHCVADNFASDTTGPADNGTVEAFAFPPVGIATSGVHCRLEATRQRLAELIARHEQALTILGARRMEFDLFGIGAVISQPVFSESSLLLVRQCLQHGCWRAAAWRLQ